MTAPGGVVDVILYPVDADLNPPLPVMDDETRVLVEALRLVAAAKPGRGMRAGFRPGQLRDPHSGEWVDIPGVRDVVRGVQALHDDEVTIRATFDFHDEKTGLTAEVDEEGIRNSGPNQSTYVSITIRDRAGNAIGNVERVIRPPDQRTVEHGGMALEPGHRGQGFATRYNMQVEASYRDHGIEQVTLNANLDVGGYSWARAGYDFRGPNDRSTVVAHARKLGDVLFGPEVQEQIRRVADNPHSTPADFAMIGYTPGAQMWPGKKIMLGSNWTGVKALGPSGGYSQPELGAP